MNLSKLSVYPFWDIITCLAQFLVSPLFHSSEYCFICKYCPQPLEAGR